jgi:5-dehydro-4-deoxyglucarate dehydratase
MNGADVQFNGVLFFPVTPFGRDDTFDAEVYATHVDERIAAGPGGVFAACGTGEFHALSPEEYEAVVGCAVKVTAGRLPVVTGCGGPLGLARAYARRAEAVGADGLLVMPPYLVRGPQSGLVAYVRAIAAATDLPLIVYNRDNAAFSVSAAIEVAAIPQVVGFKDGAGDLDSFARIVAGIRAARGAEFAFFNGLPTAEATVPAYRAIGVELYSSAVFCFAPEIALAFYAAVATGDGARVDELLRGFYHPLVELRSQVPGYAVSLVKAAVRLQGLDVGSVRAPLVEPTSEHLARLEAIIANGISLLGAPVAR